MLQEHWCERAFSSNYCPCFRTAAHLLCHGLRNNLSHPTRTVFSSLPSFLSLSSTLHLPMHHPLVGLILPHIFCLCSNISYSSPQFIFNLILGSHNATPRVIINCSNAHRGDLNLQLTMLWGGNVAPRSVIVPCSSHSCRNNTENEAESRKDWWWSRTEWERWRKQREGERKSEKSKRVKVDREWKTDYLLPPWLLIHFTIVDFTQAILLQRFWAMANYVASKSFFSNWKKM